MEANPRSSFLNLDGTNHSKMPLDGWFPPLLSQLGLQERIARVPYLCLGDTLAHECTSLMTRCLFVGLGTPADDEVSCAPWRYRWCWERQGGGMIKRGRGLREPTCQMAFWYCWQRPFRSPCTSSATEGQLR